MLQKLSFTTLKLYINHLLKLALNLQANLFSYFIKVKKNFILCR